MKIRLSQASDGERAVDIWRRAVDATHDFLSAPDRAAIEAEVRGFLPHAPLWLAVDQHDVVQGFMLLDGDRMEALFVDPACHGRGVGRALVEHALALQPALATDVNEQNPGAAAFYERMGFARTGRSALDGQGRPYPLIHLRSGR
ncbi:putative acetyltransferase [Duganella sacchari]|jgi:putative acetyltransferase|uniref:Putative acetyltransferase n=1 Tax=Duganella sacchari TaxID=551987 RepID=A0A1M7IDT3_9BURK|nr:acetyltransferase [Duganella sacchari]SHM38986.1 putative acetyltransferase [Duganella sacchari]